MVKLSLFSQMTSLIPRNVWGGGSALEEITSGQK
jgi:hypothetical protein